MILWGFRDIVELQVLVSVAMKCCHLSGEGINAHFMNPSSTHTEGYPSGRKGAVLKTVWGQPHKSSNLLPSARHLRASKLKGLLAFLIPTPASFSTPILPCLKLRVVISVAIAPAIPHSVRLSSIRRLWNERHTRYPIHRLR